MLSDPDFLLDSFAEPESYENDDFTRLCQAWVNEKCAPELLAFEEQLVENLLEMVETQVRASPRWLKSKE